MQFDNGRAGGFSGCNSYGGEYRIEGNRLVLSDIAATAMACLDPDGIMEQEQRFLAILGSVTSLTIEGDGMELSTDDGVRLVFVPAE
jgi:heat shock protein HslJ